MTYDEQKKNETASQIARIESTLSEIPIGVDSTNYLLASVLLELRDLRWQLKPRAHNEVHIMAGDGRLWEDFANRP